MIFLYWLMSLSMILFHVLLILAMAPLIMVFMERLNGKIQGKPLESSQYVLQNIKIIYSRILNFLFKKILSVNLFNNYWIISNCGNIYSDIFNKYPG